MDQLSQYTCTFKTFALKEDMIRCKVMKNRVIAHPLITVPIGKADVIRYIRAGLGCRDSKAETVYESLLGDEESVYRTIEVLVEAKRKIGSLSLSESRRLTSWWNKHCSRRQLSLLGLYPADLSLINQPCSSVIRDCLTNPYKVVPLPLEKAQSIAALIGIKYTEDEDACAKIARELYRFVKIGWTCRPVRYVQESNPSLQRLLPQLMEIYDIGLELDCLYLPLQLETEKAIVAAVLRLLKQPERDVVPVLSGRFSPSPEQELALQQALNSYISIITGGAGTGKTTLIAEICHNLDLLGEEYLLCSFTGKAVDNLHRATKRPCVTIDRFVTYCSKVGEQDLLEALGVPRHPKVLIIDEASMVTTDKLLTLLRCIGLEEDYRIILVGDVNQLPPIGWGNLLKDLLGTNEIPTIYLRTNHRVYSVEGEADGILLNASAILDQEEELELTETPNFSLMEAEDLELVVEAIHSQGDQVTILTPYNAELNYLNKLCQSYWSDSNKAVKDGQGTLWQVGDRVMMTVNNYSLGVMNGQDGVITSVSDKGVNVDFEQTHYLFALDEGKDRSEEEGEGGDPTTRHLQHSFAITVHKSQGSEKDFIILYVPKQPPNEWGREASSSMFNYQLMYTAITRAKRALYILGDIDQFRSACRTRIPNRISKLGDRIIKATELNRRIAKNRASKVE